ncbi:MAG: response regulator [Nitrospirae bacterium]|nr:MAG: response regulator [Nitrospirota bacterium]
MPQTAPLSFLLVSERAEEIKRITQRMRGFYPGCHIEAVYTAEEALDWVSRRTCDAALLDERLSGRSGLEILSELRRRSADAAILVLTDHYDAQVSTHLTQAGADHVLSLQSPVYLAELPVVTGTMLEHRDRLARLDLADKRAKFLFETIKDVIYELDPDGRFVALSPAVAALLGHSAEELLGTPYSTVLAPQDRDRGERRVNERRTGARATHRLALRLMAKTEASPDTQAVPVECSATGLYSAARQPRFLGTIGVLAHRTNGRPSTHAHARPLDEGAWQEKVETVRRLAGRIAHDFNNMLTIVTGYSQLILNTIAPDNPQRHRIEEIAKAGERAADLTRQLLAFSRRDAPQEILDINVVIADMEPTLRQLTGRNVRLALTLAPGLGRINAAPVQIRELLHQLAVNAVEAMPDGGRLTIATDRVEWEQGQDGRQVDARQPGPAVRLTVSDTGVGMDPESQARLAEPFFTTKEGKWLGLGLAMVYGIAAQSGGVISVVSAPGQGTTFTVHWPRVDEKTRPIDQLRAPAALPKNVATILLVEDEISIRSLARTVLEEQGYTVLEAGSAAEAMRISDQHQGPIHLLLTDVVMPGMNGFELAARLNPLRPEMKLLFISGYTGSFTAQAHAVPAGASFLPKPFMPDTLEHKVREVLDEPR